MSNGIGDFHARQAAARTERGAADGGHGIGDFYARQAAATIERVGADGGHGAGNDGIFTTCD